MRFKVDEDLPEEISVLLRARGHDAITVMEQRLTGSPDSRLWKTVQREKRCLLTADKGFANAQMFPPGTHEGIVLLRLPRESRAGYIRLVEHALSEFDLDRARGAIVSVSPDAIRIHRSTK